MTIKTKNPLPRDPKEIKETLDFLEYQKGVCMSSKMYGAALAIGSQIEMLLWAYNMQPDRS